MNGYLVASLLWYVVLTAIATMVARRFDGWIECAHQRDPLSTAGVLPVSTLVILGVAGTEVIRLVRACPLAIVLSLMAGWGAVPGLLIVVGIALDALLAYVPVGVPMVVGDLRREARARHAAESWVTERMIRAARQAREAADADGE